MFSEIDYPITLWRANLICNVASSLASGFSRPLAKHLDPHLIFSLEGPAVCGSTRDFIENFCVADLLKMGMILILSYFGLLLLCLLHKVGVFGESEEGKRRHGSTSDSSNVPKHVESRTSRRVSCRWMRNHRGFQVRTSLWPKSHGIRVRSS
ncbi:uncharacterized protein LOC111477113 isoform X1 [Cucurbita maxima]|uniref:Uncharacterized protein LOC111477113 isoform X1 n=1 Tax=Cucurbita maxima TaxID=3661 RepID=A0A6J1IPW7_CUCMA|nr:uncharacterized protein LOC111477113 isoform X1 [Cucurbita maxima]